MFGCTITCSNQQIKTTWLICFFWSFLHPNKQRSSEFGVFFELLRWHRLLWLLQLLLFPSAVIVCFDLLINPPFLISCPNLFLKLLGLEQMDSGFCCLVAEKMLREKGKKSRARVTENLWSVVWFGNLIRTQIVVLDYFLYFSSTFSDSKQWHKFVKLGKAFDISGNFCRWCKAVE